MVWNSNYIACPFRASIFGSQLVGLVPKTGAVLLSTNFRTGTSRKRSTSNSYHPVFYSIESESSTMMSIAPRLSVDVRRHVDRLPDGLASCLPSPVEVQAHHRHHARHAGAVHRRDDGDLLLGLFADVEAAAVSGAGADCGAVLVGGEGRPEPHAGQRPVLPRLLDRTRPPTRASGCGRSFTAWWEKRTLSSVCPACG